MSLSFRAFIILCLMGVTYYTLHPSLMFYFNTTPEMQRLAELSQAQREGLRLSSAQQAALERAVAYREQSIKLGLDLKGGLNIVLQADFEKMAELAGRAVDAFSEEQRQEAMDRIVNKIQNRIDTAGVSELVIRKQENYRLNLQLPGETSSERIENIVSTTGNLTFQFVNQPASQALIYDEEEDLIENEAEYAADYQIAFVYERDPLTGRREKTSPLALEKEVLLTGDRIIEAAATYGEYNNPVITFSLDLTGAQEFAAVTARENYGKQMAIVLDGRVMSAPGIGVTIVDGNSQIEGSFTIDEARDLALILKSGSLPVPIKFISKQVIGPNLGQEMQKRSFTALFFALLTVIGFMLLRYRVAGVVASLALLLNGVMIVAFLSSFGLTISLSGVAGLILTAGIAIDANVIIFERVKEEVYSRRGQNESQNKSLKSGLYNGYERAFWSIFDSNLTTLIAAFVLFYYGSGALQGFATTLFVGIIISMFTALFFTRFLFALLLKTRLSQAPPRWVV